MFKVHFRWYSTRQKTENRKKKKKKLKLTLCDSIMICTTCVTSNTTFHGLFFVRFSNES